ncbi:type II secretion system protein [Luteolibacter soli]|uniref:Type II secretion system protein n=1 Tax=Luteolibacter soli TaxID=3135280 RepID=A0ABU9ASV8_9BACT
MTLLELTVVILVLLTLISVLFIGANAWKNGSDRVLCILNLQSVQKGVRSYSNLSGHNPGETVSGLQSEIIGLGRYVEVMPECPGHGNYSTTGDLIPPLGSLYLGCSLATTGAHEPSNVEEW